MKAGTAGGVEAVVKAIDTHINNASVCKNGCGALWNMTTDSSKSIVKKKLSKMKLRTG